VKFLDKFNNITAQNRSFVCIGLDPDFNLMPKNILKKDNPIWEFNKEIIEATKDKVAAYKLNYAFYIANGFSGLKALAETISFIPKHIPIILDVKVGDIANTMANYAKGYLEYMNADAITVNPLMGEDVMTPLIGFDDKFFFVLALTSNPSATDFLKQDDLYKKISHKISQWGTKQFGAVVGATNPQELKVVRSLMPDTLFLIPGIGAQGGNLNDVMTNAAGSKSPLILINSSRGIIHKSKEDDFADIALKETELLRDGINRYL
jgi:orotidine-5'-phosphate decarboxylase